MTQTVPVFAEGLDDICQEFLVESYENLDELDRALVALEQDPGSRPLIASIFRTIHTIKGTSGFLAFTRLESVTHVGENVLSQLRDGHLTLTPEITTTLLRLRRPSRSPSRSSPSCWTSTPSRPSCSRPPWPRPSP